MPNHDADVAAVREAMANAAFDTLKPYYPEGHEKRVAVSYHVTDEQLLSLTAAGSAVVILPEGVAVEHGARLVLTGFEDDTGPLYAIEATP